MLNAFTIDISYIEFKQQSTHAPFRYSLSVNIIIIL